MLDLETLSMSRSYSEDYDCNVRRNVGIASTTSTIKPVEDG
jgi:hypothetical protein